MISFVTHPYHRGGVTAWTIDAVNHLVRKDQGIRLIGVQPRRPFISGRNRPLIADLIEDQKLSQELPLVGIVYELGTPSFRAWVLVQEILRKVPQGSVLIPSDDEACWMACAMVANRYRFIGVVHSDDPIHYRIYDRYYTYLTGVVTISNRIRRNLSVVDRPIRTAPCGIVIPALLSQNRIKHKLVYVGRLDEHQKRISDLAPLMKLVREHCSDARLEVWGHGGYSEALQAEIHANNMEEYILLKGWGTREEILKSLASATLLLQVSNFEGMSIAVMEALAMGCMVVSSEVSGVEDYAQMEDGRELIRLFPIGDVEAASKAIGEALSAYNEETPKKARAFAERYFSIETCMNAYLAFAETLSLPDGIRPMPMPGILERLRSRLLASLRFLKYKIGF